MTSKTIFPEYDESHELKPKLIVFGVGGAGGNAVNNMISSQLSGVEFWVANTDAQALKMSQSSNKIQLGIASTKGLGAGSNPNVGRTAAEESKEQIKAAMEGCHMIFITAGMGGGTGTGAAPIIAQLAKEMGILTVGVVTKPFHFEGARRMNVAELGLEDMAQNVDTLIVIPNQNLFRVANEKTTFADAFQMADMVLDSGVRGVTDLITMPGVINLDFADIRTVMSEMGKAMMGTGEAEGEERAIKAAEAAISNPLLDHSSMKGAKGVLINITGGQDMTLFEVDEAANRIKQEVDGEANIIFGSAFNPNLEGKLRVSVVATGIDSHFDSDKKSPSIQNNKDQNNDREKAKIVASKGNTDTVKETENIAKAKLSQFSQKNKINIHDNYIKTSSANNWQEKPKVDDYQEDFIPSRPVDPEDQTIASSLKEIKKDNKTSHNREPIEKLLNNLENDEVKTTKKKNTNFFEIPAFFRKKK